MDKKYILHLDSFLRFQKTMVDRIAWPYSPEQDSIFRWRARLLFTMLFLGLILGSFVFIAAATLIVEEGAWGLAIVDTLGLLLGVILLVKQRIRFEIRAAITSLTCYLIGIAVIISVGPLSGGPIWLFSFAVLTGALMGNWAAFIAILINIVSLVIIGLLISTGTLGNDFPLFNTPQAMIAAGGSFFFLNTITSISVSSLLEGLNESEKRYRLIAENVADVIWTMDMDLRFTYISPSIFHQRGYTAKEAMVQTIDEVLLPSSVEKNLNLIAEKLSLIDDDDPQGWRPVVFEAEQYCKDGSIIWTSTNARILPGPDKKPKSILGVTVDITMRKKSEEKLRKSEEKFRTAFTTSPNSITISKIEDGTFVDVNDGFIRLMGYSREEIIGKSSVPLNIWNDLNDRDRLISGLKKNGLVEYIEAEFKSKDGRIINGLMSAQILDIEDNKFLLSVTQDITELKKSQRDRLSLEKRLQQAQKMESLGTLAGGIAHDFNNVLSPILGYTEMLLDEAPDGGSVSDKLNKIYTGAVRARDLVKQILTFSRQDDHQLKSMKIQPVVKEALKLMRSTIPANIDIKHDISNDCGSIKADTTRIHQIIMNLITNAYHAMEETGGKIEVLLKEIELGKFDLINLEMEPGAYAYIKVADTGIGMDKDLAAKIFDPFFTTKKNGKGTGMGLSVVHGIVNRLGGAIQVQSERGIGTEFKIYFPIETNNIEKQNTQIKDEIQTGTEHILLVDDEEEVITMEKQMLEHLGYQVTSRICSIEALENFRSNPNQFDLVVTDMAMPNLSGSELAVEMIKIRPDISILLCTGFSEVISEEKASLIGIKGFLMKPFKMNVFAQKIREILDELKSTTTL